MKDKQIIGESKSMVMFASFNKLCTLCNIDYTDFRNIHNFMTLMELQPFKEFGDEDDTIWSWLVAEGETEEVWEEPMDVIYGLIKFIENKEKYWEDLVTVIKKHEEDFDRWTK